MNYRSFQSPFVPCVLYVICLDGISHHTRYFVTLCYTWFVIRYYLIMMLYDSICIVLCLQFRGASGDRPVPFYTYLIPYRYFASSPCVSTCRHYILRHLYPVTLVYAHHVDPQQLMVKENVDRLGPVHKIWFEYNCNIGTDTSLSRWQITQGDLPARP